MRTIGLLTLLLVTPILAQTTKPATQPAKPPAHAEYLVGEMHLQSLPELNYLSISEKTSFAELFPTIQKLMTTLSTDMEKANIRQGGPIMFVYHDMKEMDKPFTLEIGMLLMQPVKDTGALKFRKAPAQKCATILLVGSVDRIGMAYEALAGAIKAKGLEPSGEMREMYLYWEKPESPNNVVQIQWGYKEQK